MPATLTLICTTSTSLVKPLERASVVRASARSRRFRQHVNDHAEVGDLHKFLDVDDGQMEYSDCSPGPVRFCGFLLDAVLATSFRQSCSPLPRIDL